MFQCKNQQKRQIYEGICRFVSNKLKTGRKCILWYFHVSSPQVQKLSNGEKDNLK